MPLRLALLSVCVFGAVVCVRALADGVGGTRRLRCAGGAQESARHDGNAAHGAQMARQAAGGTHAQGAREAATARTQAAVGGTWVAAAPCACVRVLPTHVYTVMAWPVDGPRAALTAGLAAVPCAPQSWLQDDHAVRGALKDADKRAAMSRTRENAGMLPQTV